MIDSCVNISKDELLKDYHGVLKRAKSNGVNGCVLVNTAYGDIEKVLKITSKFNNFCTATAGVHPHYCSDLFFSANKNNELKSLHDFMKSPLVSAIGETGLDYEHEYSPKKAQQDIFSWHLEQLPLIEKPLFLHERGAFHDFISILKSFNLSSIPGVIHCFTGDKEVARHYVDMGFYLGISGWITDDRRNSDLLDAIRYIPKDRIIAETDSPFLLPKNMPYKAKFNEPQYLSFVIQRLADLLNTNIEEVKAITQKNTETLFKRGFSYGDV